MNEAIELHDSKLVTVSCSEGAAVLLLSPAYVHCSAGRPGNDTGFGWLQAATLTITDASVIPPVRLPSEISNGSLLIGTDVYEGIIPATGTFEAPIELRLVFSTSESLVVHGARLIIALVGERTYVEEFQP